MSSFALAFLASLIGGFIATVLVALIDRYLPLPSRNFARESPVYFPHPARLLAASIVVFGAWFCLLVFFLSLALTAVGLVKSQTFVLASLGVFLGLAVVYLGLALTLRCPNCKKHVTVQWGSTPPFAEPMLKLDGWASVIARVALKRRFRCMYCGQQFLVTRAGHKSVA